MVKHQVKNIQLRNNLKITEKNWKKTEKEIFEVFDKINSYYSEIQKIRSAGRS